MKKCVRCGNKAIDETWLAQIEMRSEADNKFIALHATRIEQYCLPCLKITCHEKINELFKRFYE